MPRPWLSDVAPTTRYVCDGGHETPRDPMRHDTKTITCPARIGLRMQCGRRARLMPEEVRTTSS